MKSQSASLDWFHALNRQGVPASCRSAYHTRSCSLQTAYTIPILAFAFVCHPEVLPIYTELRKWVSPRRPAMFVSTSLQNVAVTQLSDFSPSKARMQKVSNISIFVMYIMYFLAALFGYLTFKGKSMFFFLKLWKLCTQQQIESKTENIRFPSEPKL